MIDEAGVEVPAPQVSPQARHNTVFVLVDNALARPGIDHTVTLHDQITTAGVDAIDSARQAIGVGRAIRECDRAKRVVIGIA